MFRVAIVEDNARAAAQLEEQVKRYAAESGEELEISVFSDGMDIAGDYRPIWDLILLDIEMPLLNGMTAAERIREKDSSVLIIFVTNMAQYAIQGYSVDALDFVVKPVNYYAFRMKLQKAFQLLRRSPEQSVLLSVDGEVRRVPASAIRYVEVADHRLIYHTAEADYTVFGTLKELESTLGRGFARCNHCYLVNLRYVSGIQGENVLVDGTPLKIARARRKEFLQQLSDYCAWGGH